MYENIYRLVLEDAAFDGGLGALADGAPGGPVRLVRRNEKRLKTFPA